MTALLGVLGVEECVMLALTVCEHKRLSPITLEQKRHLDIIPTSWYDTIMIQTIDRSGFRVKILDAAMFVIRAKGYAGTSVDDICQAAEVTKGSFFHYFKSKEELAVAAAGHFASMADGFFAQAAYRQLPDPVDRLLGYVDFRIEILQGPVATYTCLLGTLVQETYSTHPVIRTACEAHLTEHIDMLVLDIDLAKKSRHLGSDWTSTSLAYYMQSVIQGAFIFAKAEGSTANAVESLKHLRRYVSNIFNEPPSTN